MNEDRKKKYFKQHAQPTPKPTQTPNTHTTQTHTPNPRPTHTQTHTQTPNTYTTQTHTPNPHPSPPKPTLPTHTQPTPKPVPYLKEDVKKRGLREDFLTFLNGMGVLSNNERVHHN
ncbi:hypothetical protein RirG_080330 [Rhizophagus irregularis DAOM 197198w]|uniref:Uncharacterized protein n=1 Tax=Rhizophagus irregularis (strain DAOM 197198w) TaxID=1432141 RepID=A0A015JNX4_RHIIW|nr:hypothetical protein RirG_080330 [Rhizophagus irregularis DAOM 197198w]